MREAPTKAGVKNRKYLGGCFSIYAQVLNEWRKREFTRECARECERVCERECARVRG